MSKPTTSAARAIRYPAYLNGRRREAIESRFTPDAEIMALADREPPGEVPRVA